MKRAPSEPLGWIALLPLDVSLAISIICLYVVLSASETQVRQDKARIAGALLNASTARIAAMEQFALTGEFAVSTSSPVLPAQKNGDFSYQYVGSRIDASGTLRVGKGEFRLSLTPAIRDSEVGWTVIWSCGERKAPDGWTRAGPSLAENLQDALPYMCRDLPVQ